MPSPKPNGATTTTRSDTSPLQSSGVSDRTLPFGVGQSWASSTTMCANGPASGSGSDPLRAIPSMRTYCIRPSGRRRIAEPLACRVQEGQLGDRPRLDVRTLQSQYLSRGQPRSALELPELANCPRQRQRQRPRPNRRRARRRTGAPPGRDPSPPARYHRATCPSSAAISDGAALVSRWSGRTQWRERAQESRHQRRFGSSLPRSKSWCS